MNTFVILGLLGCVSSVYSSDVVQLNPNNFNSRVIQSDDLWIVEFYAPWCGHCKNLAPEYEKVASALKGVVKVGAVDADQHQSLGGQYGVRGFPTLKIFGSNKNSPEDYNGGRTADAIVEVMLNRLKSFVKARLSGRGSSSGGGGRRSGGGSRAGDQADVVELTDNNFQELVIDSEDMWMVEFFAPWCGHCKNLAPEWASAASQLKGHAKFGAVDATVHTVMASRYGVQGYPTIKMFPSGKKDGTAEEYDGGRTASDIVNWVESKKPKNIPTPEVVEITSQETLKDHCEKQLCVVSILPHILDCQSECRNKYIKLLKDMAESKKELIRGWVWAEAGAQENLEKALGMGYYGYPAMVAVKQNKGIYVIFKGAFSESGITEFLRDLKYGKGAPATLQDKTIAKIEARDPWDGKDGELPVEDDIDLSDVDLDEKDEL